MLDRRTLLTVTVGGLLGGLSRARRSLAGQAGSGVEPLGDGLSLVTSGGTNVLARSTGAGLVLVDSGTPERTDALLATLRELSPDGRVATLFNTHWHPEHTGANETLGRNGATIVAHENTRLWMATPTWMPEADRYRPPRAEPARPTETFYDEGSMTADGEPVEYGYLIEAHTSGDIYIFFRDANVLAVGDVAAPVQDPALDALTGAWIGGRLDALDRLLAITAADTRIVPGFGPVLSRAELEDERNMIATIYERSVDRVREGTSVEDMLDAGVLDGLGRSWQDARTFLREVHQGLWAHHNKLAPNIV